MPQAADNRPSDSDASSGLHKSKKFAFEPSNLLKTNKGLHREPKEPEKPGGQPNAPFHLAWIDISNYLTQNKRLNQYRPAKQLAYFRLQAESIPS